MHWAQKLKLVIAFYGVVIISTELIKTVNNIGVRTTLMPRVSRANGTLSVGGGVGVGIRSQILRKHQSEGFPRTGYLFPARDGLWPGLKKEVLLARRRRRRRRRRHLGIGSFLSQLPT